MSTQRVRYFVSPDGQRWKVTREGGTLMSHHETQRAAIRAAVDLAHQGKSQVLVMRPDGTFRTEWTYGKDPYPPPG